MSPFRLLSQQVFLVRFGVFELFFFSSVCRILREKLRAHDDLRKK